MSAPGGVLALDLSYVTGWAYGCPEVDRPAYGTWHLPTHISWGAGFAALENELDDALEMFRPSEVAVEAPLDRAMAATARGTRNEEASFQQFALAGIVEASAYRHSVRVQRVHCCTARKAVIGVGNLPRKEAKAAVLRYCSWRGWKEVPDDNCADALIVWQHRASILKLRGRIAA